VGHYIFRDGRVRDGRFADSRFSATLYSQNAHQPVWFTAWLEEIFADVYGCLVAGPVIALESQALNIEDTQAAFLADDGEHPVGVLRPFIYLSVLKCMAQYENAVQALMANWQDWREQRGNPTRFQLKDSDQWLDLAQTIAEMDTVVEMLLQPHYLGMLRPKREDHEYTVWSHDLKKGYLAGTLYADFDKFSKAPDRPAVPPLKMDKTRQLGATGLWLDAIKDAAAKAIAARNSTAQTEPVLSIPAQIWAVLLDGGGWATEGPGMPNLS
jgi:hypothetical protein